MWLLERNELGLNVQKILLVVYLAYLFESNKKGAVPTTDGHTNPLFLDLFAFSAQKMLKSFFSD